MRVRSAPTPRKESKRKKGEKIEEEERYQGTEDETSHPTQAIDALIGDED